MKPLKSSLLGRVNSILEGIPEPKLKWSLKSLGLIRSIEMNNNDAVNLRINLVTKNVDEIAHVRSQIETGFKNAGIVLGNLELGQVNVATEGVEGIKNIILVGSGKGGVGKSSVAVNLADGLSRQGQKVGLMDADIFGPSIPQMMGVDSKPEVLPDEYLMPIEAHGIKLMSVGFLVNSGAAIEWRGVVAAGTLLQFIRKTFWGTLDYLVIDMPPGAGDIHLSLAHELKANGAVVVTTPQEVVLGDVRRSIDLFEKCHIPILGLVENMSYMVCEHCNGHNLPFTPSKVGLPTDIPVLAKLPLSKALSHAGDLGIPALLLPGIGDDIIEPLTNLALKVLNSSADFGLPLPAKQSPQSLDAVIHN